MLFRFSQKKRFETLVRPHLQRLYQFAYHLSGNQADAEDLVQDVMIKLFPQTDKLEAIEQLGPWLKRVLYHQFIDSSRYRSRQPDVGLALVHSGDTDALDFLDSLCSQEDGPEAKTERARLQAVMQQVLLSLPPDQRVLLILAYVEEWSQEDISGFMDIPVGTIKSRLHRCRSDLQRRVKKKLEPFAPCDRLQVRG